MKPIVPSVDPTRKRLERIMDPHQTLTREDIVWVLEWIKKKVADEDPALLGLSQPRLLANFHFFAETAMLLIHRRSNNAAEVDRIRLWLREASYGLTAQNDLHRPAAAKKMLE